MCRETINCPYSFHYLSWCCLPVSFPCLRPCPLASSTPLAFAAAATPKNPLSVCLSVCHPIRKDRIFSNVRTTDRTSDPESSYFFERPCNGLKHRVYYPVFVSSACLLATEPKKERTGLRRDTFSDIRTKVRHQKFVRIRTRHDEKIFPWAINRTNKNAKIRTRPTIRKQRFERDDTKAKV